MSKQANRTEESPHVACLHLYPWCLVPEGTQWLPVGERWIDWCSYPCPEYYQPIGSVSCGQSRKWVEGIAKLGDGSQELLRAQCQVCVSQQEAASSLLLILGFSVTTSCCSWAGVKNCPSGSRMQDHRDLYMCKTGCWGREARAEPSRAEYLRNVHAVLLPSPHRALGCCEDLSVDEDSRKGRICIMWQGFRNSPASNSCKRKTNQS